jgi:DHA3 family macrolide efflux protein-like MFS transporter
MEAPASAPEQASEAEASSTAPAASPGRLWNRNFVLLWVGQTISHLGNPAFNIGAMLWMMEKTGSASLMGLLMTCAMIPGILLGPFGGTFADRHSRVRIMVWGDLISGAALVAFAAAVWLRPDDTELIIPLLFVVAVSVGVVRSFFGPAATALVPDLVPRDKLPAANSLNQFSVQASITSGQAIGGVLYKLFGPALLFCIDGLSFLFAGLCTLFIPRDRVVAQRAAPTHAHPFRQFLAETGEGFRYVWAQTGLRDFMIVASVINFLATPGMVLFPFYVDLYLDAGKQWYGYMVSGISVGAICGFLLAGVLRLTGKRRATGILIAMLLYPVFFGSLAFLRDPIPALVAVFLGGMTTGIINVYLITMIQAATPAEMRGRVMGFLGTLSGGLMPLGMAIGGFVGDLTGKNVPLIIGVCSMLAMLTILLLGFRRPSREFLAP